MPATKRKPTTVYLDPRIARAAKVQAALTDRSLSDIVNEALKRAMSQDEQDMQLIRERRNQPTVSYEQVKELKRDGLL